MAFVIPVPDLVPHRLVVELRYEQGELFWDRCGRVARSLAANEGWAVQSIDANGCHILKEEENIAFSYTPTNLSLNQTQNREVIDLLNAGEFGAKGEEFANEVIRAFDVSTFPRLGFREWFLFGTETLDAASVLISRMSLFSPDKSIAALGTLSKTSHTVEIERPTHIVRLIVAPFEQQIAIAPSLLVTAKSKPHRSNKDQRQALVEKLKAQKAIKSYPRVGVVFDLDAYIEDVDFPGAVGMRDFVLNAHSDFQTILRVLLTEV